MRGDLSRVYEYRSNALHAGITVPAPMSWPPQAMPNGEFSEKVLGEGSAYGDAVWAKSDTHMTLHIFAYIARGALLNWWLA
jgi:hypothetical protein